MSIFFIHSFNFFVFVDFNIFNDVLNNFFVSIILPTFFWLFDAVFSIMKTLDWVMKVRDFLLVIRGLVLWSSKRVEQCWISKEIT